MKFQLIRFRHICTRRRDLEEATGTLFRALRWRGYSRSFLRGIKNEVDRGPQSPRRVSPARDPASAAPHLLPFITTFSPAATALRRGIQEPFLALQQRCPEFAICKIISAHRKNKNLKDHLVWASLSSPPVSPLATHFFRPKLLTNLRRSSRIPIYQEFELTSTNLVYAIQCRHCQRLYVGQTKNALSLRLRQHLGHIEAGSRSTHLYDHFSAVGRGNLSICGLENGGSWSLRMRFHKERTWIRKLDSMHPHGLNDRV